MNERLPAGLADVERARSVLAGFTVATPLLHSAALSSLLGFPVYLKAENLQRTGSFKVRGAFYKMSRLPAEARARGVVSASAGNHAQGVALAASQLGIPATIVMPAGAPITKVQATAGYGAQVVLHGATVDDAYDRARELERETGATFIPGFDDPDIVAGQGTIGLEILDALPDAGTVLVPVGGGGLISGIALAIKSRRPAVRVVGVQAAGAPAVHLSWQAGRYTTTDTVRTIADGIAVRRPGVLNWEYIRRYVDDVVTVDEEEIGHSILLLLERARLVVEGAGAVGLAALLGRVRPDPGPVVVVLSGGNIDVNILSRIIERGLVRAGRYVRLSALIPDRPGSLKRLLSTVAAQGANVLQVHHERWLDRVTVGEVEVDLALETRDHEHAAGLIAALERDGYSVRRVPPLRPTANW